MEGFTYHNIFDTKGIEYIVIIMFFMVLVPFWFSLNRRSKQTRAVPNPLNALIPSALRIPKGILFNRNHTWMHLERSGSARIGIDDLLLHVAGKINVYPVAKTGEKVKKGDLLSVIDRGGKQLRIFSPVSGEVVKVNHAISENPALLYDDPFNNGWMVQINPNNWIPETRAALLAEDARAWFREELSKVKDFMMESVSRNAGIPARVVLQDGGELRDHTLDELPPEMWVDFEKKFLKVSD